MKSSWRALIAAIIGTQLLLAQNPSIRITSVSAGFTLTVTSPAGLGQLDMSSFAFYVNGADQTAAFVAFVNSGSPIVSFFTTPTTLVIFIAANFTGNSFAAKVCTIAGLCGTQNIALEGFDNTAQRDAVFVQTFGQQQARWNDVSAPSQLAGRAISGSPAGPLGTRIQFTVDPQPPTPSPAGLFSPFDAAAANSGGQCGANGCNLGSNPNGGSHIMHIYEAGELSNTRDSLEQIEWSPVNFVTQATTYPNYKIWCGVSNTAAPLGGGTQQGLNVVFDSNYTLLPYQTGIPTGSSTNGPCGPPALPGARKVPCGSPAPYVVPLATTQFMPFPILNPCFDFATSTGTFGAGVNLLVEQDIDAGNQAPNFNRFRATAFQPVRRLLDGPLASVPPTTCPFNHGGTFDIYRMRFTFVGLVSQARSLWYDTGLADPNYLSFILTPPVNAQPAGTQSTWILEGTDIVNPGPGTIGASAVYINAAGVTFPTVLSSTISHLRYFRFRLEFRGNNAANTAPAYTSVAMVYF